MSRTIVTIVLLVAAAVTAARLVAAQPAPGAIPPIQPCTTVTLNLPAGGHDPAVTFCLPD